jgi:hypothetical protein
MDADHAWCELPVSRSVADGNGLPGSLRSALVLVPLVLALVATTTARAQLEAAPRAVAVEIVVSLGTRTMWVIAGRDTLRTIPSAVASGRVLRSGRRRWQFSLPRGARTVLAKRTEPIWTPADWHYVEEAQRQHLTLRQLPPRGVRLRDGRLLLMRDSLVGLVTDGASSFNALPINEHIVFDGALYIPPIASRNRRVVGQLGHYALDLGDGFLIHGTQDPHSIGSATTHGCIRLGDADIAWLFEHTPVRTIVSIQ